MSKMSRVTKVRRKNMCAVKSSDIRKIKDSNGKPLSQEEQRHLSDLLDFAQKQERNASPFDIYRDLFAMEVRKSGVDGIMSIRLLDGSDILARYRHVNRRGTSIRPKVKGRMWRYG